MKRDASKPVRRRGRPHKFGRPGQLVTLTLPADVIRRLRSINRDLARAIVEVFESTAMGKRDPSSQLDTELFSIADRRSLIVINSSVIQSLPGVSMVPLDGTRAFLAMEPGRGVSDLELSVIDRLDEARGPDEVRALQRLRQQLKSWRKDPALRFHGRAIIVVEAVRTGKGTGHTKGRGPRA